MKQKILIVVDMQNDFITGTLGSDMAADIVGNVKGAIREAQNNNSTIIFTRDTHDDTYLETSEGKMLPVVHCIKDTNGWQVADVLTEGIDTGRIQFVDKPTFGYTGWNGVIKATEDKGADLDITLIGVCTDICVVSNALLLKAFYPEANISVIADCCAGVTKESHEAALVTMQSCQINII